MTHAPKDDLEKAGLFTREPLGENWVERLYENTRKPFDPLTPERFEAVKKAIVESAVGLCVSRLKTKADYIVSPDVFKKFVDAGIIDQNGNILYGSMGEHHEGDKP